LPPNAFLGSKYRTHAFAAGAPLEELTALPQTHSWLEEGGGTQEEGEREGGRRRRENGSILLFPYFEF